MCAALLKMKKRATTSSTRSKDWRQLHTLVHASILRKYGNTVLLHVSVKLRRLQACAALSGMQRRATMSSTRSKHWCKSHMFLTVPHMPAALKTWQTHVIAQCGYICGVLEHAQVCAAGTSPLTLVKLIVALFFIFNNAAHICGLSYLN